MTNTEKNILAIHDRWIEAEIQQNIETLGSLLHDDVLCILPGGTRIEGRGEFAEFLAADSPSIHRIDVSNMWVKADADLAVLVADFETQFTDNRMPRVFGTHTWCVRKNADEWRIQLLTWTLKGEQGGGGNG